MLVNVSVDVGPFLWSYVKSLIHRKEGLSAFLNKAAILHKFACVNEKRLLAVQAEGYFFLNKYSFLSGGFDRDTPYNLLCYVLITHVLVDGST